MRVPRDPATYQHQDRREDRGNRGSQVRTPTYSRIAIMFTTMARSNPGLSRTTCAARATLAAGGAARGAGAGATGAAGAGGRGQGGRGAAAGAARRER